MKEVNDVNLGGSVSTVIRRSEFVHRGVGAHSPAVHALLAHLERTGFTGAPRFRGIDEDGREVMTFVPGDVTTTATPDVMTEEVLRELGRLLRRMHEAAADFILPEGIDWAHASETEIAGVPVPCHNDLSPKNVVFRDGRPVAFIDWDLASPNPPTWDLAHVIWQFVPLVHDEGWIAASWQEAPPLPERLLRVRAVLDGYGLDAPDRRGFGDIVALRMQRTAEGIAALADAGEPAFVRFRDAGVIAEIDAARAWVVAHYSAIDRGIQ